MKTFVRLVSLWMVLGFLACLLLATDSVENMTRLPSGWGLFVLPALAVGLTAWALAAEPAHWLQRRGFWMALVAGWAALLLIAEARAEWPSTNRLNLSLAFGLASVVAVLLALKTRSFPTWRGFREVAFSVAIFALPGLVYVACYVSTTRSLAAQGEARWAGIGLPMADFEKSLVTSRENGGSEVVRQVFREEVGARFYREGTPAAEREPAVVRSPANTQFLKQAVDIMSAIRPPSDDLDLSASPVAEMASMAPAFEANYRRILAAEPPAWNCDPHDGFFMGIPNFQAIRQFSQITAADILYRLSAGDQEGAARALAAATHVREGLRQNPTLISLLVDTAVDALLAQKQVRLPAAEDDFEALARDAASRPTELLRRLRMEGWILLRYADQASAAQLDSQPRIRFLPDWAGRAVSRLWMQRECALATVSGAEHAAILQASATMALPDFGASLHDAAYNAHPSIMDINVSRAAMRIQAMLLLREQSALIRDARARLAAGRPVESRASVVLPHLRWELTADAEKNTVATRLAGAPEWIVKNEVTSGDFWVLPLDGSVAWQFRRPAQTASGF